MSKFSSATLKKALLCSDFPKYATVSQSVVNSDYFLLLAQALVRDIKIKQL